jgi:uncharacterized membrane protein YgcG
MSTDITAWQLVDDFIIPQYDDGQLAEGTFDVLQRVLMILLSETDSARYAFDRDAQRACAFMSAWRQGDISNEADVLRIFSLCQSQVKMAMDSQETDEDPPERQFKSLEILRIVVQPGTVQLRCKLETQADSLLFTLPIPI